MKCGNCGNEINENSKFCTNCGSKIDNINSSMVSNTVNNTNTNNKVIIFLIVIVAIVGILIYKNNETSSVSFKRIYDEIGCTYEFCDLALDGSYLEIDTNPDDEEDYFSYKATSMVEKANKALGFSDALYNRMGKTRALDGTQVEENKKYKVTWTYHPDDGLEVIYAKK